jgi:hypothetical protein
MPDILLQLLAEQLVLLLQTRILGLQGGDTGAQFFQLLE